MAKSKKQQNEAIKKAMRGQSSAKSGKATTGTAERPVTAAPKPGKAGAAGKAIVAATAAADRAAKVAAEPKQRTLQPRNLKTANLPNKVRELRLAAGLTPAQLADKAGEGMDASAVRRIERGARQATHAQVVALAKALGTSQKALEITEKPQAERKAATPKRQVPDATGLEVGEVREVEIGG